LNGHSRTCSRKLYQEKNERNPLLKKKEEKRIKKEKKGLAPVIDQ
jgi:hypothetical protein